MNILTLAFATEGAVTNPAAGPMGGALVNLLPMVAIFVIFYFLLIRPQMKKQKELQNMVDSLKKGDQVVAAGGLVGKIIKIEDDIVHIEIDTDTKVKVRKNSITEQINDQKTKSEKK